MLDIKTRRIKTISMLASSLTMMVSLTFLNLEAFAVPPKTLTPEELKKQRDWYLQYQRSVQTQLQRQEQVSLQQKQQRERQEQQQEQQLAQKPDAPKQTVVKLAKPQTPIPREEVLLVMPAKGASPEEIKEAIESANGEICGGLGAGALRVILVKARPGKVVELQRKLAANTKDFLHVDFNRKSKPDFVPTSEPTFSKSWHLTRMHVPDAWDIVRQHSNFPMPIAVFDSGAQGPEPYIAGQGADCTGKVGNDKVNDLNLDGFLGTGIGADSIQDKEGHIAQIGK